MFCCFSSEQLPIIVDDDFGTAVGTKPTHVKKLTVSNSVIHTQKGHYMYEIMLNVLRLVKR